MAKGLNVIATGIVYTRPCKDYNISICFVLHIIPSIYINIQNIIGNWSCSRRGKEKGWKENVHVEKKDKDKDTVSFAYFVHTDKDPKASISIFLLLYEER